MSKEKRKKKTDDDLQNNTQNTKDWATQTPKMPRMISHGLEG